MRIRLEFSKVCWSTGGRLEDSGWRLESHKLNPLRTTSPIALWGLCPPFMKHYYLTDSKMPLKMNVSTIGTKQLRHYPQGGLLASIMDSNVNRMSYYLISISVSPFTVFISALSWRFFSLLGSFLHENLLSMRPAGHFFRVRGKLKNGRTFFFESPSILILKFL